MPETTTTRQRPIPKLAKVCPSEAYRDSKSGFKRVRSENDKELESGNPVCGGISLACSWRDCRPGTSQARLDFPSLERRHRLLHLAESEHDDRAEIGHLLQHLLDPRVLDVGEGFNLAEARASIPHIDGLAALVCLRVEAHELRVLLGRGIRGALVFEVGPLVS